MATTRTRTFGDLLRRSRLAAGLTLEELAERAGLSAKGIGALERGERRAPRRETVALLADALQLADADRVQFESVARQRTTLPLTAAAVAAPSANLPPLIGRTAELVQIERHLAGDGPPVLLLSGEPGIGKTRLLREAAEMARVGGWTVLEGGCHRSSGQEPYAPILGALERRIHGQSPAQLRADLEGCAWLARLLPELAETTLVPSPQWNLPPPQERRLMFAAVGRYLANLAGPTGALLILDDLQWAGADALDLVATLVRAATDEAPLRIVGAYRSTEVQPQHPLSVLQHELMRESLAIRHELEPLQPEDASVLLNNLLGIDEPGEKEMVGARERVLQRAGGMPLFLVSYAQPFDTSRLAAGGDPNSSDVPDDVADSIRQRVAVLPRRTQSLLGIAAVAGRSSTFNVVLAAGKALSLSEADALDGLHDAVQAKLLLESAGGSYSFAHDLIHEVITADLGSARVTATHRHIAEALEELPGASRQAAELAWHFASGAAPDRALPYALLAGVQAEVVYAHAEAERQYRTAAGLAHELDDRVREAEALLKLGTLVRRHARLDDARQLGDQTLNLFRAVNDLEGVARATALLITLDNQQRIPQHGIERYRALAGLLAALRKERLPAGEVAPSAADHPDIANVVSPATASAVHLAVSDSYSVFNAMGANFGYATRADEVAAQEFARQAWLEAKTADDVKLEAQASLTYATSLAYGSEPRIDETIALYKEAVRLAESTRDLSLSYDAAMYSAIIYGKYGMDEDAQHLYQLALEYAERVGVPEDVAIALNGLAYYGYQRGEWTEAQRLLEQALPLCQPNETSALSASVLVVSTLAELVLAQGQSEDVAIVQEILTNFGHRSAEHLALVELPLAERDLLDNAPHRASERLAPLLDYHLVPTGMIHPVTLLAWAALASGDDQGAAAYLEQGDRQMHWRSYAPDHLRVKTLLAMKQERWQDAEKYLDEAVSLAHSMPYPYAEAKALYVYGQLHMAQSEPERARECFTAALTILNRLGERLYAEHVEQALAKIGG